MRLHGTPVHQSVYARDPVHPAGSARLSDHLSENVRNAILLDAETQDELNIKVASISEPLAVPATQLDVLIVVGSANPASQAQADPAQEAGFTVLRSLAMRQSDPQAVLGKLSGEAVSAIRSDRFGAILASGGDTMEAVLRRLGIMEFTLLGELEAGFPSGFAKLDNRSLILDMKAGGFGKPETLLQASRHLLMRREKGV